MKTAQTYGAVLVTTAALWGCGSAKVSEKTTDGNKDDAAFVLKYNDVMEFTRGVQAAYNIGGNFTGESNSTITIDGLPETAAFTSGAITWLPPCDLKPENGQFIRGYMIRRIRITMKSALSDGIVQRPAILIVHKDGDEIVCDN